jgi:hypothetical protein
MELFLTVIFWVFLLRIIGKSVDIIKGKYPRKETFRVKNDIAKLLIPIIIFCWVIYLKWHA